MKSDVNPSPQVQPDSPFQSKAAKLQGYQAASVIALGLAAVIGSWHWFQWEKRLPSNPWWEDDLAPLVMQGGDPHIRALMRTISASESNSPQPYSILYGGTHTEDLSQHPDRCIPILAGPNLGDCSTAAGRYQFITTTWQEKAEQYHPKPPLLWFLGTYNFAPEYQDEVVYRWLSDPVAWDGIDLAQLLREGRLEEVLYILSPTWTSLGYGIETNVMTGALPEIYEQMLQEEMEKNQSQV